MGLTPDGAKTKTEKLDQADARLQAKPSVNSPATGTCQVCNSKIEKSYVHIGLRLVVKQFNIEGRQQQVLLPVMDNRSVTDAEVLHKLSGSPFPIAPAVVDPRLPQQMYGVGGTSAAPDSHQADLTAMSRLLKECGVDGYQYGGTDAWFNEHLGRAIGLHIMRDQTFTNTETGDFHCKDIHHNPKLHATEKMGMKIFAFVRIKLDGMLGIYEVQAGIIGKTPITQAEYDKRKVITDNQYQDSECGSMPLIPGVQQFNVLIEDSGGGFRLKEVYCDGDCLYPS